MWQRFTENSSMNKPSYIRRMRMQNDVKMNYPKPKGVFLERSRIITFTYMVIWISIKIQSLAPSSKSRGTAGECCNKGLIERGIFPKASLKYDGWGSQICKYAYTNTRIMLDLLTNIPALWSLDGIYVVFSPSKFSHIDVLCKRKTSISLHDRTHMQCLHWLL